MRVLDYLRWLKSSEARLDLVLIWEEVVADTLERSGRVPDREWQVRQLLSRVVEELRATTDATEPMTRKLIGSLQSGGFAAYLTMRVEDWCSTQDRRRPVKRCVHAVALILDEVWRKQTKALDRHMAKNGRLS